MTKVKVVSLILIIFGGILFLLGILFKILHWPGLYYLLISGSILIITGIALILRDNKIQINDASKIT